MRWCWAANSNRIPSMIHMLVIIPILLIGLARELLARNAIGSIRRSRIVVMTIVRLERGGDPDHRRARRRLAAVSRA